MGHHKRILVADAIEETRNETASILRDRGHRVVVASDGEEASTRLIEDGPFDLLIVPCILPKRSGLALCRQVSSRQQETSTLLLLEVDEPQVRGLARMCGAGAVLPRPFDDEQLVAIVERTFRRPDVETMVAEREDKIRRGELKPETSLSILFGEGSFLEELMDKETGLYNKTYVMIKLEEEFKKSQRYGSPLVCCVLRYLKPDAELFVAEGTDSDEDPGFSRLAGALLTESRDTDVVGRVSPRDILQLLPNTNLHGAKVMLLRLCASIGIPACGALEIGISVYPSNEIQSADDLVRSAELGLAKATALLAETQLPSR